MSSELSKKRKEMCMVLKAAESERQSAKEGDDTTEIDNIIRQLKEYIGTLEDWENEDKKEKQNLFSKMDTAKERKKAEEI